MKKVVAKAILVGIAVGMGSVIYDLLLDGAREFNWWRILTIGVIAGVISAAWVARKPSA